MAYKPQGLSPNYNSIVAPQLPSSYIFSWTFIKTNSKDYQKSSRLRIFPRGSASAIVSITQSGRDEEIDITPHISKLTLGSNYDWEVTVTASDNSTASSGKKPFKYKNIALSPDLLWPDGPVPYEYIGTRAYFNDIKENTKKVLNDYVVDSKEEKDAYAAAGVLFNGDIVPAKADFQSLEDILALIAKKEQTYTREIKALIEDGLGAEDIHKIYKLISDIAKTHPVSPSNVHLSFSGITPVKMASASASNKNKEDLTVDLAWKSKALTKGTCTINIDDEISEDVAYYKFDLSVGFTDYLVTHRELIYDIPDIVSLKRKIKVTMDHIEFHHLSKSKKTRYEISSVVGDKRSQESSAYLKKNTVKSVPLGLAKYTMRVMRRNITDTATIKNYWDIYNGKKTSYVHKVSGNAPGVYKYAVRYHDINGEHSPFLYIPTKILIDPLKAPAAPKPKLNKRTYSSLSFSWPAVKTATSYDVKYGSKTASQKGKTKGLSGLKENKKYSIKVRAVNRAGKSKWVTVSGTTLKKPIKTYSISGAGSRVWRGTCKIKLQSGGTVHGKAYYMNAKTTDDVEVLHGEWIELRNKYESGYYVKKGTAWGKNKSIFFLDHAKWRKVLKGKTIVSVKMYIKRNKKHHGYPNDGRVMHVYTHNYASKSKLPAASKGPILSNKFKASGLNWRLGQGKWITLPKSFGEKLRDNKIKGFALYHPYSDKAPYEYMRLSSKSFILKIQYK